jgi:hypothetical protein
LTARRALPVFPDQRALPTESIRSEKCQKLTSDQLNYGKSPVFGLLLEEATGTFPSRMSVVDD